jgi:endonuclease YncB( thermonuclease family)
MPPHDFVLFPELTNSQMEFYYLQSPHKQILYDFRAEVVKVIDGDTIRVKWSERDFDFPVRFLGTNAPEMNEGGEESKSWLENMILEKEVEILIDPKQRVGKWGRILGTIYQGGLNINDMSIMLGMATSFENRNEGKLPNIHQVIPKWH